jgi:hypothetical protein
MNKKNLSISALSGVVILGLIMTFVIIPDVQTSEVTNFEVNEKFSDTLGKYSENLVSVRGPSPKALSDSYETRSNTLDDAITSSVSRPSVIPRGFELKAIFSNDATISQFYMLQNKEITAETTFEDVMDNGGFVIIQVQEDPEFDKQNWLDNYGKGKVTYAKISDSQVIVVDNDGTKGEKSQLFFYKGDTFVNFVSVSLNAKELLQIANSMY